MRYELAQLDLELMLAKRLGAMHIFRGMTTLEMRRERFRRFILEHRLETKATTVRKRGAVTYAQAFETVYGEAL